jgi:hypothetical protein
MFNTGWSLFRHNSHIVISDYFLFFFFFFFSVAAEGGAGQVTRPPREANFKGRQGGWQNEYFVSKKINFLLSTNFNFLFRPIKVN